MAPTGTPPETIAALNAAFNAAIEDSTIRTRLQEVAVIPFGGPPERMGKQVQSEAARWGAVIRKNNIRAE